MFTDMVGYTALGQRNEVLALSLAEEQRRLIRQVLARHEGKEVKTMGDAFLIHFPNALEAVRCAYDIQRTIREFNLSLEPDRRIHVRIGLHVGDVIQSQEDISGDAVNVASRIEALAEDGGVCITRQVFDHVHGKFDLPLESLGAKSLKNVAAPLEVYRIIMPWSDQVVTATQLDGKRVAVLPLVSLSSDPNDEFFADGLTEEMISTLSKVGGLTVISRTSTMQYKGAKKNLVDIGRELGAGTLLEGSVRKVGNRVRITVQLLDASKDKHLWAESYDRELQDIFAVQSDVATNVAASLKVRLLDSEAAQIRKRATENSEAFMLYLKGRQYWNKRSKDAVHKAMEYFQLAVDADPGFALAFVGLADCWSIVESWGYASPAEAMPKARQAVLKALKLDDKLAEAHASYALILAWLEWRWEEAELELKRAIELNPNYASAHQWYSHSVLRLRRQDDELTEAFKALELDPIAPIMSHNVGQTMYFRERYDEAIDYFERALTIDPNFVEDYLWQAQCYLASSRFTKAIELFERYLPLRTTETRTKVRLVGAYGMAGRTDEAKRLLAQVQEAEDRDQVPSIEHAWAYFGLGEIDSMFDFLERSASEKGEGLPFALINPVLKSYRSDRRFLTLRNMVGI
jgi:adenylate cyclase